MIIVQGLFLDRVMYYSNLGAEGVNFIHKIFFFSTKHDTQPTDMIVSTIGPPARPNSMGLLVYHQYFFYSNMLPRPLDIP